MSQSTKFSISNLFKKSHRDLLYWEERAILDFTESIAERLGKLQISNSLFAEKMGVSLPYVTKLMGGGNNFTLRTMVKVACALGARLPRFKLEEPSECEWTPYQTGGGVGRLSVDGNITSQPIPSELNFDSMLQEHMLQLILEATKSGKYDEELALAA